MSTCSPVRAVTPSNFIALSFSAALTSSSQLYFITASYSVFWVFFCGARTIECSAMSDLVDHGPDSDLPNENTGVLPFSRDASEQHSHYDAGSEEEGPPAAKRSRYNFKAQLQNLQEQINSLVEFLPRVNHCLDTPQNSMSRPSQGARVLHFGDLKTSVDEKRTLRPASKERLEALTSLQRFNSPEWREVRYSSALKEFIASPGFTDLKVNEELCHLDRKKDSLLPTERVLAGLSNAILEQRELIKSGLQSIIDGSFSNPENLNPDTLFNSFESLFGPGSQIQKNLDQMSQVICGKRAECIETRREHLLTELRNKNVQMALRKVPPSSEYLFNKADLSSLIQSLGGAQNWLNTPAYITSRRGYRGEVPVHKSSSSRTTQSSAGPTLPSTSRFEFRRNKTNTRGSFQKPQSIPKPSGSFRKKPADT